jgi:peptidoglycan/xylan/chitin deacetylase (PgdA/CDA1 family)
MKVSSKPNANGKSTPRVVVTTSWDDDAVSGMRVADLLGEKGIRGTFYVPTGQLGGGSRFTGSDLRLLSGNGFEIGAHTISHRILIELGAADLVNEIHDCKPALEQILGREVVMFCYPRGRFNAQVVREVQNAGYGGARTTRMLCSDSVFSPFHMPTTVQAYPHTRSNYLRNLARLGGVSAIAQSVADVIWFENWLQLGKKLFDEVLRDGGIWHLYGHPWELANLNLWGQLNEMLDHVGGRDGVAYLTNGQLLQRVKLRSESVDPNLAVNRAHSLAH